MSSPSPSHIFIIPYRNRESQRAEFIAKMPGILDAQIPSTGSSSYQIWIIHQCDDRLFNRGALLNIGFREAQARYPDHWRDIQFVFHDIDIMPTRSGILDYNTVQGKARHPYGDPRPQWGGILGCFCIIMGADYAKAGGSPNYFGWGGEDVALSRRCQAQGIIIDEHDFIMRRSCLEDVIDPESNPTLKQQAFCQLCDRRNLAQVFGENPACPTNNYRNLDYKIIQELESHCLRLLDFGIPAGNIRQLDCQFDVIG